MEGFRKLPALSFSPTEVMALVISRSLLQPLVGTEIKTALDSAMAKASRLLPRFQEITILYRSFAQHRVNPVQQVHLGLNKQKETGVLDELIEKEKGNRSER
jgi:predicted DNA-binding transcriptional regulator YafY